MEEMKEIIDERTVEMVIRAIGIGVPVAGVLVGALIGLLKKQFGRCLLRGAGIGSLGLLVWVMWVYYSWTVRYDPNTGYVGLHKVSVLLINVVVFAVVGAIVGWVWGWFSRRTLTVRKTNCGATASFGPFEKHGSPSETEITAG